MAEQSKDTAVGRFFHEDAPAAAKPGELIREGHDYSATLRLLAQLKAVRPPVPAPLSKKLK